MRRRKHAAAAARSDAPTCVLNMQADLPSWMAYPDVVRTRWMNTVSDQLWPHLAAALSKFALKDDFLEDLLNSNTFWKPPWLASSGVRVEGVVLGQAAPHISGERRRRGAKWAGDGGRILCEFVFKVLDGNCWRASLWNLATGGPGATWGLVDDWGATWGLVGHSQCSRRLGA